MGSRDRGPRLYQRGRYWSIDTRPYGGKRESLRNPADPNWPYAGERTEYEDIARKWSWDYVAFYRDGIRRRQLGLPPRPRKLEAAYTAFLGHRAGSVAENTRVGDRTAKLHLLTEFGDTYTDRITTDRLQAMVNAKLAAGYKPGTIKTLLTSLSAFFGWLGQANPVDGIELSKFQEPEIRVWSESEVQEIYDSADYVDSHRTELNWPSAVLVCAVFLNTGCRQMEGFGLETTAINEASSSMRIYRQLDRRGQKFAALKGRLARTTFILDEFYEFWPAYKPDTPLLLGRTDGRPLGNRSQKNLLQRVLDGCRLYELGTAYHSMRHTFAKRYLEGGGSLGELQVFLGHTSIRTTEQTYRHFKDSVALRLAHERFDGRRLRA